MEELVNFISNVGFPIVLSVYLLNRIETRLDNMIETLATISNQLVVKNE